MTTDRPLVSRDSPRLRIWDPRASRGNAPSLFSRRVVAGRCASTVLNTQCDTGAQRRAWE
jgi:hypothetical protein